MVCAGKYWLYQTLEVSEDCEEPACVKTPTEKLFDIQ